MNKYIVETLSIHRIRYVIEAKEASHATDEVVMHMTDVDFTEFSQYHVDEVISSVREISNDEYVKIFDEDNDYLKTWPNEQKFKFVRKIDYNEEALTPLSQVPAEITPLCGEPECCGICNEQEYTMEVIITLLDEQIDQIVNDRLENSIELLELELDGRKSGSNTFGVFYSDKEKDIAEIENQLLAMKTTLDWFQ